MQTLLHDYAERKLGKDISQYHNKFLATYNPNNLPWYQIELDNYLCENLPFHLINSGKQSDLPKILHAITNWMDEGKVNSKSSPLQEALVLKLWSSFWSVSREDAEGFYRNVWLRKSFFSTNKRARLSYLLAVRCAFEVNYIDGLVLALCHSNEQIRLGAVNYTFYISNKSMNDYKERTLGILQLLVQKTLVLNSIPNISVIKSIFQLAPLIIIDHYQENVSDAPYIEEIILQLNRTLKLITEKSVMRFLGPKSRSMLISLLVNIYRSLII